MQDAHNLRADRALKPIWRGLGVAMVLLTGAAPWPAVAQPAGTQPAAKPSPIERPPRYTRTEPVPDALLGPQRRDVVILPSQPREINQDPEQRTQGTQMVLQPEVPLLPEGYVVASRQARVYQRGQWYEVELVRAEGLPDAPPLRLLPNARLGVLEAIISASQAPPIFIVTGRVTEFYGQNYMLLESLEEVTRAPAGARTTSPGPGPAPASPATQQANAGVPSAEEIINRLLQQETVRPVALPRPQATVQEEPETDDAGEENSPAGPSAANRPVLWPEETLLIDRAGRIIPGEPWWALAFEDQGRKPSNRPIRLLPNRLLESAIALSKGQREGTVLIVSGELTLHKNTNYLLLRKVLVRRDLGNFR